MDQRRLRQFIKRERQETLENEIRARLLDYVEAKPGVTASELAAFTGCSYPSTRYHLDRLERALVVVRHGGTRPFRYFAAAGLSNDHRQGIAALRSKTAARVMALVEQAPGMSKADLGRATGLGGPTIAWHLRRLAAAGLVQFGKDGRRTPITPVFERLALVQEMLRAFEDVSKSATRALEPDAPEGVERLERSPMG